MRAKRNRTLTIEESEKQKLSEHLLTETGKKFTVKDLTNKILNADIYEVLNDLPSKFVDLLIIDPPYNLNKKFGSAIFKQTDLSGYEKWMEDWFGKLIPVLKQNASVYVCSDWKTSPAVYNVLSRHLIIRNRITWEREKGRGSKKNWKNCSEDIWFATTSNEYKFNPDNVKLQRKVLAPYTNKNGDPKDWEKRSSGNFRLTFPSNLWNDITIPFWSMPENTDHPTQKPEKLAAKLILASSDENDFVLDPFLGSGTTAVTAKKLGRRFCGIEKEKDFSFLAVKRLLLAEDDKRIQGYDGKVFWERNTLNDQKKS